MKNVLIITVVMALILFGCRKDSVVVEINESTRQGNVTITISTIEGQVAGIIYDENNNPIANTIVEINGKQEITDEQGTYFFSSAFLNEAGTYIRAEKEGFIVGSDLIYPIEGLNTSFIQMMALTRDVSFQAETGGTIQIERGGSIDFDLNAIASPSGDTYTGEVYVTAKRLATDDPQLEDKMPGDLLGRNAANQNVVLATLGMVAVELRGEDGEELNLKEGNMASITFPIADKDQAFAPETIPLWYFDEIKEMWIEEGSATRVGNNYVGNVTHFSFWNCDAPFELVYLCVDILNGDGTPVNDVKVKICTNGLGTRSGRPQGGVLNGKIPKDEILEFKIFSTGECSSLLYQADIGPFGEDVKLDPILLENKSEYTLTGKVVCNSTAVSNAQLIIQGEGLVDIVQADENGQFTYSTCSSELIQIFAKNVETGEGSQTQEVNFSDANPVIHLDFETCDECAFEVEVAFDNAIPCNESVEATAMVSGNGDYTYAWSDGSTGESISLPQGEYAVTVSETNTECEKVIAFSAPIDSIYLSLSFATEMHDCDTDAGGFTVTVLNGVAPFTYEWSDIDGTTIGNTASITGIQPGNYFLTVTDDAGCTITSTRRLSPSTIDLNIQDYYLIDCNQSIVLIDLEIQDPLFTYLWIGPDGFTSNANSVTVESAGIYTVEITNSLGCTEIFEVIVEENTFAPVLEWALSCNDIYRDLVLFNNYFNAEINLFDENGVLLSDLQEGTHTLSIFDFQQDITLYILDIENGCGNWQTVNNFFTTSNSLQIDNTTIPSCASCTDGNIQASIIDPDCNGCTIEVYTKSNNEYVLLTAENDNNQLGVGTYYVSLKDESGCVTEFLTVEL